MIKNYLRIAFRNLFRNKLFSALNVLGLAFGIGCSLLIFLWVNDELGYDQFHAYKDRLYKVRENQFYTDGNIFTFSSTPGPMAPFIKEKFPEIEKAARMTWDVNNLFQFGDKSFMEEGRYVDPDFIQMFSFPLISGDDNTALNDINSIIISSTMAEKFFGRKDPMGKLLVMNSGESFVITGVFENVSSNSSLKFEYLLPFQYFWNENKSWLDQWGNNNIRTNLLLAEGTDVKAFEQKLRFEIKEHVEDSKTELIIQPFTDDYLYGKWEDGKLVGGRIDYVRIFFIVAIFILAIASINFMNLATAQASRRAKEVGLRKVVGAVPWQLMLQFIGESLLITLLSSVVAIGAVSLFMPMYNELTGKVLSLDLLDTNTIVMLIMVVAGTGFFAGSYPAFFISRFQPGSVLKGNFRSGRSASSFRKALVVMQFTLSIFLIISTIVVYRQMDFTQNQDIGLDRKNIMYSFTRGDMGKQYDALKTELMRDPSIELVTATSQLPIQVGNSTIGVEWEGKDPNEEILFSVLGVKHDFFEAMKMKFDEGRGFSEAIISDSSGYVVNEVAAAKFGFDGSVVGREIVLWKKKGPILGVVKNFNFGSLHEKIEPIILYIEAGNNANIILARANNGKLESAIKAFERVSKQFAPAYPFQFEFMDTEWQAMYQSESRMSRIFNGFAVLSIFISCLGLFGLSAYSAERRTKELGIRKVMGASVPGLVQLVSKEFVWLIIIAAMIGCPIGWYLMNRWLEGYAFHVDVGYITLAVATLICLVVSMITVGYHSLRVSLSNPAESLRYE